MFTLLKSNSNVLTLTFNLIPSILSPNIKSASVEILLRMATTLKKKNDLDACRKPVPNSFLVE